MCSSALVPPIGVHMSTSFQKCLLSMQTSLPISTYVASTDSLMNLVRLIAVLLLNVITREFRMRIIPTVHNNASLIASAWSKGPTPAPSVNNRKSLPSHYRIALSILAIKLSASLRAALSRSAVLSNVATQSLTTLAFSSPPKITLSPLRSLKSNQDLIR
jgi:hypothetical protein